MNSRTILIGGALLVIVAVTAVWVTERLTPNPRLPAVSVQVRADLPEYKFINPLLYTDNPKSDTPALRDLEGKLDAAVASDTQAGLADGVSVYFRDMNTARWTGVNENEAYKPSSMLKVMVMMAVLKLAEQQPTIVSRRLAYSPSIDSTQYYKPERMLPAGSYAVSDLIDQMIVYSDNGALNSLLADADIDAEFNQTYRIFRLPYQTITVSATNEFMSPRDYSSVFRALYNSTLFQWDLSEQVLGLLASTTFDKGLTAGVPANVIVAHKFGENSSVTGNGTNLSAELHDCGIVYYPGHPYFLCVMTKGTSFSSLEKVISGMSRAVYEWVDASAHSG